MAISAKEVQALRQLTGAGMMDAKRALEENDGDAEAAALWLRERGLGKAAERSDRENAEGAMALARQDNVAALVQLKCETDFVAKSPRLRRTSPTTLRRRSSTRARRAVERLPVRDRRPQDHAQGKHRARPGGALRSARRPRARHVPARPERSRRKRHPRRTRRRHHRAGARHCAHRRVQPPVGGFDRRGRSRGSLATERAQLEKETIAEGKPEAAIQKIVEGKLTGWHKRQPGGVLLEQPFAKEPKQSVGQTARRRQDRPVRSAAHRGVVALWLPKPRWETGRSQAFW